MYKALHRVRVRFSDTGVVSFVIVEVKYSKGGTTVGSGTMTKNQTYTEFGMLRISLIFFLGDNYSTSRAITEIRELVPRLIW